MERNKKMDKKKYYISTAIAYASAIPHIGNVYEIILADAIARFKRLEGYDVYFQTGTDEHGQKIENNARNQNLETSDYVDMISNEIERIFKLVHVDRSEEHTSELQSRPHLVCRLLLEKKKKNNRDHY